MIKWPLLSLERPYALVLAGGGAKGAYQMGVWKALRELGVRFEAFFGTSVGALNAAMMASDDYENAMRLWLNLTIDQVISLPEGMVKNGRLSISTDNLVFFKNFRDKLFKNGGLDVTPLKNILSTYCRETVIRKNGKDFGLVTFEWETGRAREFYIEDIPVGSLHDYLRASAAFPGFQAASIKGKKYVDGGLVDNIPFHMAMARGYQRLLIMDVSGLGINKTVKPDNLELVYIKNSGDTGGVLDFHPTGARRLITMGYRDTLKTFGRLEGVRYAFQPDHRFTNALAALLETPRAIRMQVSILASWGLDGHHNPWDTINALLPLDYRARKDHALALAECAARTLKLDASVIWNWKDLYRALKTGYAKAAALDARFPLKQENFFEKLTAQSTGEITRPALILFKILEMCSEDWPRLRRED